MLKTIAIEASFFWIIIFLLIEDKEILAQKLLTVQLFLKLSIKTKLSSRSADSCQNLPSNFYFKLCAMFGAVVVRFLFFFHLPSFPLLDSSLLSKRNEGGHPLPPFFTPVPSARRISYTQFHAIRVVDMERGQPSPLIIDQPRRIVDYQFGIQAILVYRPRPRLCLYLDNTDWPHAKD